MDKINIESLFPAYKTHHCDNKKTLDVKVISQNQRPFDTNILIETRARKRKILLNHYSKFYETCLKKIEIANNLGKTDLLFTVTEMIFNCPEYKPIDCILYIKKKLNEDLFDTHIINHRTLFITWLYLEVNKEKFINDQY